MSEIVSSKKVKSWRHSFSVSLRRVRRHQHSPLHHSVYAR